MVTGLGEDLWPGMGMRLALSPGYSAWTRDEEWAIGCGTTLAVKGTGRLLQGATPTNQDQGKIFKTKVDKKNPQHNKTQNRLTDGDSGRHRCCSVTGVGRHRHGDDSATGHLGVRYRT